MDKENNETQKTKEGEAEKPADNLDEGDKQEATPLIEQANSAAERLEEANKKQEELLNRSEQFEAKRRLGGKADAGEGSVEKTEDTPEEYADKLLKGEVNPLKEDGYI